MISFDDIEQRIESYFDTNNQKSPLFILMDEKTYDAFCESLKPKERVELFFDREATYSKINKYHAKSGITLDILCIKSSDSPIFAIVGN